MQLHVGQLFIEAGWGDITLAFSKLAEVFKYNSIHLNFTFQRLSISGYAPEKRHDSLLPKIPT